MSSSGRPLREALSLLTLEELKRLVYRCGARSKEVPTRKDDAIEMLCRYLLSPEFVGEQLRKASAGEQTALAEAAHGDGAFHADRFTAKYGVRVVPPDLKRLSYQPIADAGQLSPLGLFVYDGRLPREIRPLLQRFLSRPPDFDLKAAAKLPAQIVVHENDKPTDSFALDLHRVDTAAAALPDLLATLALARDGRLAITKTELPTAVAIRQLAKLYVLPGVMPPGSIAANDDGVREFGFALMTRSAGLATSDGTRLVLTDEGKRAFAAPDAALLKRLWDSWIAEDSFDELSRVKGIRGQRSARTDLTLPSSRKRAIASALAASPTDGWISLPDFLTHVRVAGYDFDVEVFGDSGLYVGYSFETGWLGYSNRDYWATVQASYVRTILMEYAGTLGVIDFATTAPEDAPLDISVDIYDDEPYLSRYDGLFFFRIGPLGRYILGLTERYDGPPLLSGARGLLVLPSLDVVVADRDSVLPWERAAIERITRRASDDVYKLSKESLIDAVEQGGNLTQAEAFLRERSREALPQTVTVLFADARRAAAAVSGIGVALLVRCSDESIAQQLASHSATRRFCLLAADAHVAVPAESIAEFRRGVKRLGYVLLGERSIRPASAKGRD